jgi:hypothetical protein
MVHRLSQFVHRFLAVAGQDVILKLRNAPDFLMWGAALEMKGGENDGR